jgi:hypothetical protein
MSKYTLHNAFTSSFLSSTIMFLSMGLMVIDAAHAEQYCKSVSKNGDATYTLAPENGCHAKKMKTVAIHLHTTPVILTTPNIQIPANAKPSELIVKPAESNIKPVELKFNPSQEKSPPPLEPPKHLNV